MTHIHTPPSVEMGHYSVFTKHTILISQTQNTLEPLWQSLVNSNSVRWVHAAMRVVLWFMVSMGDPYLHVYESIFCCHFVVVDHNDNDLEGRISTNTAHFLGLCQKYGPVGTMESCIIVI